MTATDAATGHRAGRPGELLDHVVEALAGFGALDVAVLRDEGGHRVAEIVVDGNGSGHGTCRILMAADTTERGDVSVPSTHASFDITPTDMLIAERERVARDLHDGVVQDVFATAMALAALVPLLPTDMGRRLEELIDKQDEIVRRLRTTVFSLKGCGAGGRCAREAVQRVALEASRALGFEPTVTFDGAVECLDGTELLDHLLMACRESLSNIARHAAASRVDVTLSTTPTAVGLVVADDGRGLGGRRSSSSADEMTTLASAGDGLRNLDQRARLFGGRCLVRSGHEGGTVVEWRTPLPVAWTGQLALATPAGQSPVAPSLPVSSLSSSVMPISARTSSSDT